MLPLSQTMLPSGDKETWAQPSNTDSTIEARIRKEMIVLCASCSLQREKTPTGDIPPAKHSLCNVGNLWKAGTGTLHFPLEIPSIVTTNSCIIEVVTLLSTCIEKIIFLYPSSDIAFLTLTSINLSNSLC